MPGTPKASSRTIVTCQLRCQDRHVVCLIRQIDRKSDHPFDDGRRQRAVDADLVELGSLTSSHLHVFRKDQLVQPLRKAAVTRRSTPTSRRSPVSIDPHVGNHPSLRCQICRIRALAVGQRRNIVGHERVEERPPVGACERDCPARWSLDESPPRCEPRRTEREKTSVILMLRENLQTFYLCGGPARGLRHARRCTAEGGEHVPCVRTRR